MGRKKRSNKQNPPPSTSHPSDANNINIASSRGPHHHFNASSGSGPIPSLQVPHTEPTTSQLLLSQPITADPHLREPPDHTTVRNNPLVSETTRGVPCVADAAETQDVGKDVVDPFNLYPSGANNVTYIPHLADPTAFHAFSVEEHNTSARATPAFPSHYAPRHQTLPQCISPQQLHSISQDFSRPILSIDGTAMMPVDTSSESLGEHDTSGIFVREMEVEAATPLLTTPPSYNIKVKRRRTESDKRNEGNYTEKIKVGFDALEFTLTAGKRSLTRPECLKEAVEYIDQLRAYNAKLTEENKNLHQERQLFMHPNNSNNTSHVVPEN